MCGGLTVSAYTACAFGRGACRIEGLGCTGERFGCNAGTQTQIVRASHEGVALNPKQSNHFSCEP